MDTRSANKIKNKNIETLKVLQAKNIVWEKEKVYYISWNKVGETDQEDKTYNEKLYDSYKIIRGKIVPEGTETGLWGGLKYYIDTTKNTIKKLEQFGVRYKYIDAESEQSILIYNIYDGQIYWRYKK